MEVLGAFLFVSVNSRSQKQFADLRDTSFLSFPDFFEELLELWINPNA